MTRKRLSLTTKELLAAELVDYRIKNNGSVAFKENRENAGGQQASTGRISAGFVVKIQRLNISIAYTMVCKPFCSSAMTLW